MRELKKGVYVDGHEREDVVISSIYWIVSFATNNLVGYMKKAPGQLHVTRFVKSFTPIRFQNFASLVVDDVTKMCFSTPVLVFQPPSTPQNFGWPRHFGADFSFKIAKIIIAYYTQFIPALAVHLLEMWKIWPEKSILTENSKYNLQIQWQSCKRLKHLKKQRLVQMSSNLGVLNGYRILEQLPDLW